jgi:hypothetical protein
VTYVQHTNKSQVNPTAISQEEEEEKVTYSTCQHFDEVNPWQAFWPRCDMGKRPKQTSQIIPWARFHL